MRTIKGYPLPLGISERNAVVNFAVEVEDDKTCNLCIYKKGDKLPEYVIELPKENAVGTVRFVALPVADVRDRQYNYEINHKKKLDPYVKSYTEAYGELRGQILTTSYDWEGDRPLRIPDHEVIAYSLHVRGFTNHRSSKVRKKGTFMGMVEKIPYLQELGINQIHCMPVYDFDENTSYKNYWGYGDAKCFALKKTYASGKRVEKEFRDMVKEFHKNGIEVVLNLPFTENTPKQMIVECLRYYVMEYHIDGFILNPYVAPMESVRTDALLKGTKILENQDDFQNAMRKFLRGDLSTVQSVMWHIRRVPKENSSYNYITKHNGFTLMDLVSYNKKHNEKNGENNCDGPSENYSWNCGREGNSCNESVIELRNRQRRNAMALLMLSRGTPLLLAGDEFGNSQKGNNNVYCQDNEISWLNWKQLEKETPFFEYVKALIAIRKKYSVFRGENKLTGTDKTGTGIPDISYHGIDAWKIDEKERKPYLGVYLHGEDDTDCFIAYNMEEGKQEFGLPTLQKKKWFRVFTTAESIISPEAILEENQKSTIVDAKTIVMFVGR